MEPFLWVNIFLFSIPMPKLVFQQNLTVFWSESSSRTRNGCHCHEKVSKLQDLARTSYIRYLPTIICKDLLVLLSPPVCVGVCPRFCFTCQYFCPPLPTTKGLCQYFCPPLPKDYVSTSVPPIKEFCYYFCPLI